MTEATITIEDYQIPNTESIIKIANISGQLDESNVDDKIQKLYEIIEQIPNGLKLLLNLENLDYMNSKTIGYLTDVYGKTTKGSGLVVIANAKDNIIDILKVVGLTQLVKTFKTLDEAKNYLAETSSAESLAEPEAPEEPAPAEPEAAAEPEAPEAPEVPEEPAAATTEDSNTTEPQEGTETSENNPTQTTP